MKRDMDLVREILFFVEKNIADGEQRSVEIGGRSAEELNYHLKLLDEAGLVKAIDTTGAGDDWIVLRLTWEGHEFLDAARSETTWRKALGLLQKAGVGAANEILVPLLLSLGKQQLGLIG